MPIGRFGVFKPFEQVFRLEDWQDYKIEMRKADSLKTLDDTELEAKFAYYRTFQISDHNPKWAEFRIDW